MSVPFMEADLSATDFNHNIAALARINGHASKNTPLIAAKLCREGEPDFLLARKLGKYVSCSLILTLADGRMTRQVVGEFHQQVLSFFAPLFDKPDHPIVDYVRKGPFTIKLLVLQEDVQEIEDMYERLADITPDRPSGKETVDRALEAMDLGLVRVAEPGEDGAWTVNQWAKKAVLLSFAQNSMEPIVGVPGKGTWHDKVPSKFQGWNKTEWAGAGFRAVPGSIVRRSAYVAPGVVLMPSFTNLGAYVDSGTMIDTWATVGSCAQIGKNCHISGGAGIGGVLEPLQAGPVIIEDNCFIGARSEVVEGVIVREGSVLGMGVFLGQSTKILDRATGSVTYGEVPPYSVVVAGSMPSKDGSHSLYCAVIVKTVDEQTRSKTSPNDLLRD